MAKYTPRVIPEPIWENTGKPCTQFDLVAAFQWYNHNKDSKDARKYLLDYLVDNKRITPLQKQAAEYLNNSWNIVDGWFARCLSRGLIAPEKNLISFNERIDGFVSRLNTIIREKSLGAQVADTSNVISIQERVQAKVDEYIMELEGKFDDLWHKSSTEDFDCYAWMVENNIKPMHATKIAEYFTNRAKEWVLMIDARKTDEYVREAYPRTHKEYCHGANILMMFRNDAQKLADNKAAARKPRKKKPISFEKKVKSLKFKVEDTDNKLISVNPVKIIGANQLWVYNVKTRKLGVYIAADQAGLGVKGSSIENYKYKESISKTLRKPKDTLSRVLSGGKVVLRKIMEEINSKPSELNSRINKDTILLRVE
jgi:hypothetical protein